MIKDSYIGYYRVSREDQGKSGLGLSAQKRAVTEYVNGNGVLLGEFQDIESGASETRKGMMEAIKACKKFGATLVVKEMSRISRGGYKFRQALEEANINFIECMSPHDPEVVKDIKFSLAKEERAKVSTRTRDALSEIKSKLDRGEGHISKTGNVVKSLGNPKNLSDDARKKSIESRRKKAMEDPRNKRAGAFIVQLKKSGENWTAIAAKLNEFGFKTSRGNEFNTTQVSRLYNRYK